MDAKKIMLLIGIAFLSLLGASAALAGPTSVSGSMSCYMPTLLEMGGQPQAPVDAQEGMALRQTTLQGQVSIVTVCAK